MIYRLIAQWQQKADVMRMCRLLGVSRSGYYAAQQRLRAAPKVCAASVHLQFAFAASGGNYGSRRLRAALLSQGRRIGRYRVRSLMKQHGLKPRWRRKFVHTTDSRHSLPVASNILDRSFNPPAADQAWVCDITYIRTRSGWLYLAAVMDLFSRKLIGWGDGADHAGATGVHRPADGYYLAQAKAGAGRALGSRLPVRQRDPLHLAQ